MSKVPKEYKFFDLSDYGRLPARLIAKSLKSSSLTPLHITVLFIFAGITSIILILNNQFTAASLFIIIKSILDAADGELARIRQTPSYIGRYFDSVSDIILNFFILGSICYVNNSSWIVMLIGFFAFQLQGTLYNYYYVIFRNKFNGDKTSRVFESKAPTAMPGEKQYYVNQWFKVYNFCYGWFDKVIYRMDKNASHDKHLPRWFMTIVSSFGLGFQLLIISFMLSLGMLKNIIPFFILYSIFIIVFITVRKTINFDKM
jgi:phosphatidylglycerophosphate synthase